MTEPTAVTTAANAATNAATNAVNAAKNAVVKSHLSKMIETIKSQYTENYKVFIKGIPTALIVVPLTLFFLSPSASRGIFLFGAIFSSIVALLFTPIGGSHFLKNQPSFHGIALGYLCGYLLMENIIKSNLANLLSTVIMGIILTVVLTLSVFDSSSIYRELLHVGLGVIIGTCLGMIFSYFSSQNEREIEETEIENDE